MPELSLHNLKVGKRKKSRRVGRGNASGRGTYSGRGLKGQRSRSGGKRGLKRKGLSRLLRNKPKIGGFKSLKPKIESVNIFDLDRYFGAGEIVNAKKLISQGLIKHNNFKVLGDGKLTKKLTVVASAFSKSAKKAIIEAGGSIKVTGDK
ncbi:50S ribosomal protein L15 [Candidatus Falkowbacteria bacterium]|nr:50S ribosomal protein L15 [Candidatus Falkowbacteria bacterium]